MNLVVQGPGLQEAEAQALVPLVRATRVEPVALSAFRLRNSTPNAAVARWAEQREVDYAFIPQGRRLADLKLLAMDMDSTLITIECIDELGDFAGRKSEIAAITAQAMRGELDYPASLRQRVAALAGLPESSLA